MAFYIPGPKLLFETTEISTHPNSTQQESNYIYLYTTKFGTSIKIRLYRKFESTEFETMRVNCTCRENGRLFWVFLSSVHSNKGYTFWKVKFIANLYFTYLKLCRLPVYRTYYKSVHLTIPRVTTFKKKCFCKFGIKRKISHSSFQRCKNLKITRTITNETNWKNVHMLTWSTHHFQYQRNHQDINEILLKVAINTLECKNLNEMSVMDTIFGRWDWV